MPASIKALWKQNLYSQAITLIHIKFQLVRPILCQFLLDSLSNRSSNKDIHEDDFPSSSQQLSKPKEAKSSGIQLCSPQSSSSSSSSTTAVVSNPFVGSMSFTPSLFFFALLFYSYRSSVLPPYSASASSDSMPTPSYCYSPYSISSSPFFHNNSITPRPFHFQ